MNGIFVSYRRSDAGGYAGRLRDHLSTRFRDVVFQDVDNILDGEIFAQAIERNLEHCNIGVVVIGPTWVSCKDEAGRRRLDDPSDWVRLEVTSLLRRNIRVVPVLVGGARLPARSELPEDLRPLLDRSARELRDTSWESDVALLVKNLHAILPEALAGQQPESRPRLLRKPVFWITTSAVVIFSMSWLIFSRKNPRSSATPMTTISTSPETMQKQQPVPPDTRKSATQSSSRTLPATQSTAPPEQQKKKWWEEKPSYVAEDGDVAAYGLQLGLLMNVWKRDKDGNIYDFTKTSDGGLDFRQIKPPLSAKYESEHVERIERFGPGNTAWPAIRIVITWDAGSIQTTRTFTFALDKLVDCEERTMYSTRSEVTRCNDSFTQAEGVR